MSGDGDLISHGSDHPQAVGAAALFLAGDSSRWRLMASSKRPYKVRWVHHRLLIAQIIHYVSMLWRMAWSGEPRTGRARRGALFRSPAAFAETMRLWSIDGVARKILWGRMTRDRVGDVVLVTVVLAAELGPVTGRPGTWATLITLAAAALMLLSRRHPVVVVVLVGSLYAVAYQLPVPDAPVSAVLVALYAVGRHTSALTSAAVAMAAIAVGTVVHGLSWEYGVSMTLGLALPPALPVAGGHIVRLRGELAQRREQQAAENAVRAERRRIARELHDVIAHHISVVNLYIGVARRTIPADPDKARQALLTGEDMARQAMTEMRHLLDVLRTDGERIESQAGVGAAGLPALIEESGNAELRITGIAVELPAPVDHTIYRLVQEALTNTRKHAAGARSTVRLAYRPDVVELEVSDDGQRRAGGGGLGLGLAGMAERVSLCGGEVRAGPLPQGGFVVHARIPLTEKT